MERLALALILSCALLGVALDSRKPLARSIETPLHATPHPARLGFRPQAVVDAAPDSGVVDLLRRFKIHHTTLTEREQLRLANLIVLESMAHGLDPTIVMAVIEVESALYPLAVSRIGAMGLMQLLPSTGQELAAKLDIPWKGPDTLFDPFLNVRLGTAYLRELSDHYRGDLDTALAAYNWGPGRIDRRLQRGAAVPSGYVKKVHRAVERAKGRPLSAGS